MKDQELKSRYTELCSSIAARRLKPAFDMLEKLISENSLGIYHDEYRNLEETYHYMLKYTIEGVSDPERQKVYLRLIVSVFELADKVNEALRMMLSPSVEYDKKRAFLSPVITTPGAYLAELESFYLQNEWTPPGDMATSEADKRLFQKGKESSQADKSASRSGKRPLQAEEGSSPADRKTSPPGEEPSAFDEASYEKAAREQLQKMQRTFYHLWFSDKLSPEEAKLWRGFLQSPLLPVHYKSFMVTAIMLSLQRFFDQEKFMLLFDAYDSEEDGISQRALVGLLVNFYRYDSRMPFYPDISGRLKILNEKPEFRRNLERIIIQLIRSKETEKLQQRIRDEILPEMIKISPNLKNKINLESLMEEGSSEDRNPEWEDIFKDSPGLLNKMEEFSELQMKGSDVFMGSFSMLKSFPFFSEMVNWFIPFFPENPEIAESLDMSDQTIRQMVEAIEQAPVLCNSDKYSLYLSIRRVPKANLEFMTQAMKAEMDQAKEITEDEELLDPGRKAEFFSNQYIQDLYRFYKLYPRKGDFEDIFNWRLDFHNKFALGGILKEDREVLRNIAEYFFAKDHFEEAAEIFGYLLEQEDNGELYQKIAWCHQKRGDFKAALDGYLKAELYDVNQLWNLKKIALCYRNLKKPAKALKYYQEAEKLDPDNLGNQLNIGHCLLELDRYEEALKCYFKVEYLAPGNKKVWRPIAWCSFLTGKKEQAGKYFLKLMEDRPNKHDLINMGHVQWSLGNRKAALDYYRRSIAGAGDTKTGDAAGKQAPGPAGAAGGRAETAGPATEGSTTGTAAGAAAGGRAETAGTARTAAGDPKTVAAESEYFSETEFLEVFQEDLPHLLDQGVDSDDIPIMLDQLRYFLEG